MQTRSKGPVSFGEEIRREIVDKWKGIEHVLADKQYRIFSKFLQFTRKNFFQESVKLMKKTSETSESVKI